jgi:tRNA modification GTPase
MPHHPDTIVAAATPPGHGAVGIVRVSGKLVEEIIPVITKKNLQPRYATYTSFFDAAGKVLDQGVALYFQRPYSFTGEDILEFHTHGSIIVIDQLIKEISRLGARLARPGEFTERAFLNNKIDLIQAEAIADLINASSAQAAHAALHSLQGNFSKKINEIVDALIKVRAYIEAAIDFSEEEIDFLEDNQIITDLDHILHQLNLIMESAIQGGLLREGVHVVITGPPNAGKSSLLNQLSGQDTAIITDVPGTTRDVLREQITIDGMPLHIVDTAGLRESEDIIEQEGIRRAGVEIEKADIVLLVIDVSQTTEKKASDFVKKLKKANIIIVRNKIDLTHEIAGTKQQNNHTTVSLSAKEGTGMEFLKEQIKLHAGLQSAGEGTFSARRRHIDGLVKAKQFVEHGLKQLEEYQAAELLAEDLRQAQLALNAITGEFTSDDLLGRIFSDFCIGK